MIEFEGKLGASSVIDVDTRNLLQIYLTSLPKWREAHRAEKNDGYFDFRHLKLYAHVDSHVYFSWNVSCGH